RKRHQNPNLVYPDCTATVAGSTCKIKEQKGIFYHCGTHQDSFNQPSGNILDGTEQQENLHETEKTKKTTLDTDRIVLKNREVGFCILIKTY
ncbi:hypothetical protein SAMN05660493_03179, partial [Epilithonimonas bovis DSM 19482]